MECKSQDQCTNKLIRGSQSRNRLNMSGADRRRVLPYVEVARFAVFLLIFRSCSSFGRSPRVAALLQSSC